MKQIKISDITLRDNSFSFKEKLEVVKLLEKLNVDVIEVPGIVNERIDTLFLHTVAPVVKKSALLCPVELTVESIKKTYEAVKSAVNPIIHISVPTSTVQMEYMCHKKPKAVLEMIQELVRTASDLCGKVEFSALDATRSDFEFLTQAIKTAISSGASSVTVCDTAGIILPTELEEFVTKLYQALPELKDICFACECSNALEMALSSSISSLNAGAGAIKTAITGNSAPSLKAVAHILATRGDSLGITSSLKYTELDHRIDKFIYVAGDNRGIKSSNSDYSEIVLEGTEDINAISAASAKLGYDLSDEDITKVYEEYKKVATKKKIGAKELDAIIASAAMQVPSTYKLTSYVVNNGNIISATANIELTKNGESLSGVAIGDGPIDAAFRAVEQIVGRHFELDDFQIQSVTQGREAVGSAIVKLRSDGKLYSGRGVSTDIIGASIYAYINALNKICFEA